MNKRALLLGGLLAFTARAGMSGEPSVNTKIEVQEPAGLERKAGHVTSGIPLPAGFKALDKLTLKDASGKPVPCQFAPLGRRAGGEPYWALLDFQTDLPAKGKADFTLDSTGANPAPAATVKVNDTKDAITVDTGPLKFQVSKTRFNFLEAVWLDGAQVLEAKEPSLWIVEGAKDIRLDSLGAPPYKIGLEYAGPLRACIRVDGTYVKDSQFFLQYTLRIEAFAGKPSLAVTWKLRNSHPDWAFNAQIKDLALDTRLTAGGEALNPTDAKAGWTAAVSDSASLALISRFHRHLKTATLTTDQGLLRFRPMTAPAWIEKHMEHEWQLLYLFKKGRLTAAEAEAATREFQARLLAMAPGAWYQETDALGGPFGTLDDEIETYKAWGWKINERGLPKPTATRYVGSLDVHDVSENDSCADNLWQYIRTRNRAFFDVGEAYAIYFRNPYSFHRDDVFDPDKVLPGTSLDRTPFPKATRNADVMKELRRTRMCICHSYYEGLVDHYLLTGQTASLESAEDFCKYIEDQYLTQEAGKHSPNGGRYFGRPFQNVCRVFEVTRGERWGKLMHKMARIALEAPDRDERGIVSGASSVDAWQSHLRDRGARALLDKAAEKGRKAEPMPLKGWSSWELSLFNRSISKYYDITGDEDARDMLIAQAGFMVRYAFDPVHQYTGYHCVLDFPCKGDAYFPNMTGVPHDETCRHDGWYTRSCPDNCVRGYRLSGRREFLEMARTYWNRGSKLGYQQPESSRPADDVTGSFASAEDPKNASIPYVKELFYFWTHPKKDAEPPAAITDLKAAPAGKGKVKLTWTAPNDNSGRAAAYQVKHAELPIKSYAAYDYYSDEGKARGWWLARNVKGEPTPSQPGKKESFTLENLPPGTYHFAVCSDDAELNQSDLSNVIEVKVE